jgi:dephospho-CoA kinase
METIGLTGGIGMGKTTAERLLRSRGFSLVDTDQIARDVVEPGQPALERIAAAFGPSLIEADGTLNRAELAKHVFGDERARRELEEILHPLIRERWRAAVEGFRATGVSLAWVVIPLLFETGAEKELDCTVCVACSAAIQQQRLMQRGWSATQIHQRIQAQWPAQKKMAAADFVVWNDASLDVMDSQFDKILESLSARAPQG